MIENGGMDLYDKEGWKQMLTRSCRSRINLLWQFVCELDMGKMLVTIMSRSIDMFGINPFMNKEMVNLIASRWSHNWETRTKEKHTYKV